MSSATNPRKMKKKLPPGRALDLPRPIGAPGPAAETAALFDRIVAILENARARVVRSVNSEMILAYWHIGREIVESLQRGEHRAEYGEAALKTLSGRLTERFGRGYSVSNLQYFRQFYIAFADRSPEIRRSAAGESRPGQQIHQSTVGESGQQIHQSTVGESGQQIHQPVDESDKENHQSSVGELIPALSGTGFPPVRGFSPTLSWGHYRTLAKVELPAARLFYEIEADRDGWSVLVLERQIHTQLFARLRKSRDKAGVMDLITRGLTLQRPIDTLREPYVLDFLDLPDAERLHEGDLEAAIIEKLQHFLLELGKGFAFVGRQRRLEYEDEHFYVDLVFYNCILKCYLLVDLKMGKLTHQDVGQMDSYVRLFDDRHTTEGDNPTIGLILCAEKNQAVARYSVLNDNDQIFAARYVTYLPTVEELERELLRERQSLEARRRGEDA